MWTSVREKVLVWIALPVLTLVLLHGSALAGKRVALVIGNAAYASAGRLDNPVNDARDVAKALRDLAFDVDLAENLDQGAFEAKVVSLPQRATGADVVLIYYSGHGMGMAGETYLLPTDANFRTEYEAKRRSIALSDLLDQLKGQAGIVIALIDACRDNPLVDQLAASARSQGRSATVTRGLARIQETGAEILLVYATTPGRTANDKAGNDPRHSPFTSAFLTHVATPGVEVETMLKRVSAQVREATGNQQEPERLSRLRTEFYFSMRPQQPSLTAGRADSSGSEPEAQARKDFEIAKSNASEALWDLYIRRYPGTFFAEAAKAELERLRASNNKNGPTGSSGPAGRASSLSDTELCKRALDKNGQWALDDEFVREARARSLSESSCRSYAHINAINTSIQANSPGSASRISSLSDTELCKRALNTSGQWAQDDEFVREAKIRQLSEMSCRSYAHISDAQDNMYRRWNDKEFCNFALNRNNTDWRKGTPYRADEAERRSLTLAKCQRLLVQ